MTTTAFFIPPVNLMGAGCLSDAATAIRSYGFKKALVVTDPPLVRLGVVKKVCDLLAAQGVQSVVFDGVQPNPTTQNVTDGLRLLQDNACDFVISLGGGSPHDCAKGLHWSQRTAAPSRITKASTNRSGRNCPWWRSTPRRARPAK